MPGSSVTSSSSSHNAIIAALTQDPNTCPAPWSQAAVTMQAVISDMQRTHVSGALEAVRMEVDLYTHKREFELHPGRQTAAEYRKALEAAKRQLTGFIQSNHWQQESEPFIAYQIQCYQEAMDVIDRKITDLDSCANKHATKFDESRCHVGGMYIQSHCDREWEDHDRLNSMDYYDVSHCVSRRETLHDPNNMLLCMSPKGLQICASNSPEITKVLDEKYKPFSIHLGHFNNKAVYLVKASEAVYEMEDGSKQKVFGSFHRGGDALRFEAMGRNVFSLAISLEDQATGRFTPLFYIMQNNQLYQIPYELYEHATGSESIDFMNLYNTMGEEDLEKLKTRAHIYKLTLKAIKQVVRKDEIANKAIISTWLDDRIESVDSLVAQAEAKYKKPKPKPEVQAKPSKPYVRQEFLAEDEIEFMSWKLRAYGRAAWQYFFGGPKKRSQEGNTTMSFQPPRTAHM